ncbi:MAG TPA: hypothetical protein VI298_04215 [Geobacteraceae bacterium]
MTEPACDERGFTCECGTRNDYPAYVQEHRNVKLVYSCNCKRQYVLYRGSVRKIPQRVSEYLDSEAFGD